MERGAPECRIQRGLREVSLPRLATIAVHLFERCATQWQYGFDGPVGLDYLRVAYVAQLMDVEITPRLFGYVQILEAERLVMLSEQREAREAARAAERA